jgi:hypothetical protein
MGRGAIRISSKEMMLPPLLDTFFGLAAESVLPARAEGASQAGVPGEVNRGAAVKAASPATAAVPGSVVAKEAPRASVRSPLQKGGSNFSLVNHGGVRRLAEYGVRHRFGVHCLSLLWPR